MDAITSAVMAVGVLALTAVFVVGVACILTLFREAVDARIARGRK